MKRHCATGLLAATTAAAAVAVSLVAAPGATANSAVSSSKPLSTPAPKPAPQPPCSTDIIGRGPGSAVGRHVEFSYTLAGGACRDAFYLLVIRNTYDPKQWAVFVQRGDGQSKDIFFRQDLPWTPTDPPTATQSGVGLCVQGITIRHGRIDDIAPDPQDAPCEPLRGGSARAFH